MWVYLGGPRSNGAYAEYTTVPHHFVSLKPHNLTFLEAAAIPVVGLTAFMAVKHKARPTFEDSVFVAGGSGGLGSIAIQLLQTFRPRCIFSHSLPADSTEDKSVGHPITKIWNTCCGCSSSAGYGP